MDYVGRNTVQLNPQEISHESILLALAYPKVQHPYIPHPPPIHPWLPPGGVFCVLVKDTIRWEKN